MYTVEKSFQSQVFQQITESEPNHKTQNYKNTLYLGIFWMKNKKKFKQLVIFQNNKKIKISFCV